MKFHGFKLIFVRRKYISRSEYLEFLANKVAASHPLVSRVMAASQRDLYRRVVYAKVSPFLGWIGIKLLFWLPAVALDPCPNVSR
jgi:hypothetical protein